MVATRSIPGEGQIAVATRAIAIPVAARSTQLKVPGVRRSTSTSTSIGVESANGVDDFRGRQC